MTVEDSLARLPDAYTKTPDSVISRLLYLDAADRDEIRRELTTIWAWRSIDDAEGTTLDQIGRDLALPRGGMNDLAYRRRLRVRVVILHSRGEIERFNGVLDTLMGRAFIAIGEGWTLSVPEPAAVVIQCDLDALYEDIQESFERAGIPYQVADILASIEDLASVAAEIAVGGVRVRWMPIVEVLAEALAVVQAARSILTIASDPHQLLQVEHDTALVASRTIVSGPVSRFDLDHPFVGGFWFDGARPAAMHDMILTEETM